jgi:NADH-quinone oxidoreductase subunit N
MGFEHIIPELIILSMACVVLLVDVFVKQKQHHLTYALTQMTLIGAFVMSLFQFGSPVAVVFHSNFIRDHLTTVMELAILITSFVMFLFSREFILDRGNMSRGEFYVLGLFSILGMLVLVGSNSLITVFLGLELMSLPLYAMIAIYRENKRATEVAMKYFVIGGVASAMMLYGMSMVYGATGHVDFVTIIKAITLSSAHGLFFNPFLMNLGIVFIIVGIAFKLGAVPFHMWLPDVYEGSPTAVTLFIGSAPKLAAFAMLMRLLVEMLPGLHALWQPMLILLSILSMVVGNVLAIAQTNLKRMLGYSGIAHMGYMFLGVIAGTVAGYQAAFFYMLTYVLMSVASFAMLILLSRKGFDCENIKDLQGLNTRSPWMALMMLFVMFSMAGMPPFVGFYAKLMVLEAVIGVHLVWLAVVAIICAIIGLYYYLRVIKVMYFEQPEKDDPVAWCFDLRSVLSINSLALLYFGVFPASLYFFVHSMFLA